MGVSPVNVGIIGAGTVSSTYLENARKFSAFNIVAVADVRLEGARARAEEYGIQKACSVEEILEDSDVEIIINLTPHRVHGKIGLDVLRAGKHVYSEKPLVVSRDEGTALMKESERSGYRVGGAPDTFFGGAWQTARSIIDEGLIGEPVACVANYVRRPELKKTRRPEPEHKSFLATEFFEYGGGVMFDRAPYYLTALIHLFGPVRRVTGSAQITWPERTDHGGLLTVNVPTHVSAVLDFVDNSVCTMVMSNDAYNTGQAHIEIYGSEGTLRCPDPNYFGGDLYLRKPNDPELIPVECRYGYNENSRGAGVADMAVAIQANRPHRCSGEMANHVSDIVNSVYDASSTGRHVDLTTTCYRPTALPKGLDDWMIDA